VTRSPGKEARRARRLAARRPDHVRALVPVVCHSCGRFDLNHHRHECVIQWRGGWPQLLTAAELQAANPDVSPEDVLAAVRIAWTVGKPQGASRLIGLVTPCPACGCLDGRYAEVA
jgi:hypothetical protein